MTGFPLKALRFGLPGIAFGFLTYGLIRILSAGTAFKDAHTGWAVVFASGVVLAAFLLLGAAAPEKVKALGWLSVVLGADGRLSTSKAAMWLWTFGVGYALLFTAGVAIFVDAKATLFAANWQDYLVLLGGPFAAGVLAKYAMVTKFNNGTIGKTVVQGLAQSTALGQPAVTPQGGGQPAVGQAPAGQPVNGTQTTTKASVSDIVNNDDGGLDLVDSQYFLFNLVAFAYAFGVFLSNNFNHLVDVDKYILPTIPSQLLALAGASAATYVANKSVQRDTPAISSAVPAADVKADTDVLLRGVNFVPQGVDPLVAAAQTRVWVTPGTTVKPTGSPVQLVALTAAPTAVSFRLPPGLSGAVGLVVVGPSMVPTQEFQITAS